MGNVDRQVVEFYRGRARHYRELADQTSDSAQAAMYRTLAVAFDREAEKAEKGGG